MCGGVHRAIEFDCCECGSHVVAIAAERKPEPPLCAICLFAPGWMADPRMRLIFDPDGQCKVQS